MRDKVVVCLRVSGTISVLLSVSIFHKYPIHIHEGGANKTQLEPYTEFFLGNVVFDIDSGDWMKREFKPYNFNALGQPTEGGHLHPLMKAMLNNHALSFRT